MSSGLYLALCNDPRGETCVNRDIETNVCGKRQTSDSSWEFLRIENKQIKAVPEQFLWIKLEWNYSFSVEVINSKRQLRGKLGQDWLAESRLPLVRTSSIYRIGKTTAKAWNWYQRWLWRNGTRISVWNIPSGKTGLPFQMFRCSRKLSARTTKKVMFYLILSNRIFSNPFLNGKQP